MDRLEAALGILGALDPGAMPVHQARMLVFLATVPSATYADLSDRYGLSGASISRSLNTLERKLEMVEIYRDPAEGRRYRVRLSRKGKTLMGSIAGLFHDQPTTYDQLEKEGQTKGKA